MSPAPPFYYGGQAVIEGVMMRGRRNLALALRRPDGQLAVKAQPLSSLYTGRLRRLPLLRGIIVLIEAFSLGVSSLLYSAQVYAGDEEPMPKGLVWGTLALGLALALGLFFILPFLVGRLLNPLRLSWAGYLAEGVLRLGMFLAYLKLIGLWGEIKRVFAYHGAEHKVINSYEAGVPLELERIKDSSPAHIRCGTSFLLIVLVLAIFAFALLGGLPLGLGILGRLLLLPLIAAVSYEFVRFSAGHSRQLGWLIWPGLALQSLTTREPDDSQLEVALEALKAVLAADNQV